MVQLIVPYSYCYNLNFLKMIHLKTLKYLLVLFAFAFLASCTNDEEIKTPTSELENLQLAKTIKNENHIIDFYTASGTFKTGYNAISFQIKDTNGNLINNATATWSPVMRMTNMSHSCPFSDISKKQNAQATYQGAIVFQMAGNETEHWELTLNYTVNNQTYTITDQINVIAAPKRVVESFQATDGSRYVLALVEPTKPMVGSNDIKAVLYKMESMMSFVAVDGYKIKIDPRMPGMGNHGSPNNIDLTQVPNGFYQGKLNLTMTGLWRINLQVANAEDNIIKGDEITGTTTNSSIYFELEF